MGNISEFFAVMHDAALRRYFANGEHLAFGCRKLIRQATSQEREFLGTNIARKFWIIDRER